MRNQGMTDREEMSVTMKRLLKLFAFIGGIGAVGWLLQNRIVTVTMSREPKAPEMAPEPVPAGAAPEDATSDETSGDEETTG